MELFLGLCWPLCFPLLGKAMASGEKDFLERRSLTFWVENLNI
jgi:hypothetical protein